MTQTTGWGTRRALAALLALAAFAAGPAYATRALAAGPQPRVASAGPAPASKSIQLELPLRVDSRGLAAFATAVSTPGSPLVSPV